jgi:hypothetical protein
MAYCTWNNHVFGLCPLSNVSKNSAFRKLDLFPSSGEIMAAPILFRPLERASHQLHSVINVSSF